MYFYYNLPRKKKEVWGTPHALGRYCATPYTFVTVSTTHELCYSVSAGMVLQKFLVKGSTMIQSPAVSAVALIVYCLKTERILLIKECENKPHYHKVAGMLSPPMETIEPRESLQCALDRLCREEVGRPLPDAQFILQAVHMTQHTVPAHVAWVHVPEEFEAAPTASDVCAARWYSLGEIATMASTPGALRVEVMPILMAWLKQMR